MAVIPKTTGKDYSAWAIMRRVFAQCFEGESTNAAQAPLALNNESILAVNAAGTGTVALIKDNASDVTEFPNTNGAIFDGPVTLSGVTTFTGTDAITAHSGGGQSSAVLLTSTVNRVTTAAASGDSVKLPASVPGLVIVIINSGANPIGVYGTGSDTVNDQTNTVGILQMVNSVNIYSCTVAGKWYADTGFGYFGSFSTDTYADALTAHSGGGQGSATAITTVIARVTTVVAAGDSMVLPAATPGLAITVINAATSNNSMNVFPAGTDQINALGASNAYSQTVGSVVTYYSTVAAHWHTVSSLNDSMGTGNFQSTATLTATTNTVLANITGLAVTLTGGATYNFRIRLNGTAGASGGLKVAFAATSITATSFNATAWNYNGTTLNAVTNQTTLTSNLTAQTAAYTDLIVEGCIVVNAGGTLNLQAAQNASNGTSTTVLTGASYMEFWRVS